ncbi:poly-gamma-glutamate synthesis protein (capsule biosynthesis protein) [Scopulibacillus darangshiensis]|uniref:Poly-gamma-glutamate synthesis protein (Capsule biosynthesis protein) n=1 Tax=Scopulibacillus darangshiensis TaxID=442528 RepID=A0A4R2P4X2_9BACL|nr:CapA family protein [Scopulibacillus darangshiensis]TCP28815.1 poly-gamma-glutamate synthesis protein (capsule biosynthesis protein) [Scopulibacillus darangshiensis]
MLIKHWLLYFFICIAGLTGFVFTQSFHSDTHSVKTTAKSQPDRQPNHYKTSATLAAVGDVLIHDRVYNKAKADDGYDFKPMLEAVKPYIQQADISVANSESIIGGSDIGVSTYPSFNSPYEVGDALKDAGFDVVTMANNHTLDRGIPAIRNAIHHWDKIGMVHTGSFLSEKDRAKIRTVTSHDITFSFLAYTYGTNGIATPEGKDYLVNRINLPQMQKDIKQAKKVSHVVVVSLHFGTEYERVPNSRQKELVQKLADQGVDIILGCHPHVLQPVQWVTGKGGHKTFVIYSMGDFFTGQDDGIYKEVGGILKLRIVKTTTDNKVSVEVRDPKFMPTWLNPKNYHVVPLAEAGKYGLENQPAIYKEMAQHMRSLLPGLEFKS